MKLGPVFFFDTYCDGLQFLEVGRHVEWDPLASAGQSDASDQQDEEHQIWECCGEVDNLSG